MNVHLSTHPGLNDQASLSASPSTNNTNGSEITHQKNCESVVAPEKNGTAHSNNGLGPAGKNRELDIKNEEDANVSTLTKRKHDESMSEGVDVSQTCKRPKRRASELQAFERAFLAITGVQPQGSTACAPSCEISSGKESEQTTSDARGGRVLKEQVNVPEQPTQSTQDVINSQEIGTSSVSRCASEQRPPIPLSLPSQISMLLESRAAGSKVPQGRMSQSTSRPSSRPSSQPGSRVSSQPGSRAATPNSSSSRQQHATSFAATYRSPFVSPSGFPQQIYGPPSAPIQQKFLPQQTQAPQWGNQHHQPVIPCTPFSQPIYPTFAGPFPMLRAGEAYLPPPSFFQRPAPAFPITINFRTPPDNQPANLPQVEGAELPKSRSASASAPVSPQRRSGSPKAPLPAAPFKRSPSTAIENAADKMLELISSTNKQHIAAESAKFAADRQAWEADSKRKTREISRLRQKIAQLEQVAAPPIAVEPAPVVEAAPAAADGGATAETEVKRLQQEVAALQDRILHLTTHVSRLKGAAIEKMALEATVRTLKAANIDQDARVATHRARREDSAEKMLRHKARADAAVRELKAKDARIAELERSLEAAEARGQVAGAELEVSNARLAEVQGDVLDAHVRILVLEDTAAQRALYIDDFEDSCAQVAEALMGLEIEQNTLAQMGSPP